MDFNLTPEQRDAAELARTMLTDACSQPRLREIEATGTRHDGELWRRLGGAGLLGLHLPETAGGAGLGLLEVCSVAVEVGRVVAPLPLVAHAVAADALARFGSPEQVAAWVRPAADGENVLTPALNEDLADAPERPSTAAERTGDGWRVTGTKTVVPAATVADLFLVPADTAEGGIVLLVRPDDPGVQVHAQQVNDGDTVGRLELAGVELGADRVLGAPGQGSDLTRWLDARHTVVLCAEQLGVVEGALALTAEYARTREQFGRPIGTFQAVSQRLADGYIDVQGLRLTMWQAAWRLSEDLPADVEVATAKLWAADTGHKIAHTTVHVHGGVGIDLDGPAHRYFTAAKRREFTSGGSTRQALAVGRVLAAEPV
ncbi:MAG: acyl-CoA dehydrogenase family protein [Actinomycetota bacterium]